MFARTMIAAAALTLAAGCARRPLYHWGRYDESLYRHYKSPQDRDAWVESLYTAIRDAEQQGRRVPPGIYAEYGYALYEQGRFPDAVACFKQEQDNWPESRALMDKMVRIAEARGGKPAPTGLVPAASQGASSATEKTR